MFNTPEELPTCFQCSYAILKSDHQCIKIYNFPHTNTYYHFCSLLRHPRRYYFIIVIEVLLQFLDDFQDCGHTPLDISASLLDKFLILCLVLTCIVFLLLNFKSLIYSPLLKIFSPIT